MGFADVLKIFSSSMDAALGSYYGVLVCGEVKGREGMQGVLDIYGFNI